MTTAGACGVLGLIGLALAGQSSLPADGDVFDRLTHGYATSEGGVKIPHVSLGEGPLVVMIHGFPDFWYSWRHQMPALADRYQVVAIDQRGYNLSDKPKGVDSYDMRLPPPPAHNGTAYWITVTARADGSFTVTNQRNGLSKQYAANPTSTTATRQ
jgi:alpha/beta hydrolase family protein